VVWGRFRLRFDARNGWRAHATSADRHSAGSESVIEVVGLSKRYGDTPVLEGISFSVRTGELFGLLGHNGAGKTTTVEILQGLRRQDSGTATVLGLDPHRDGEQLRRMVGAQLQSARLRVVEALRFFAALHPHPRPVSELTEEWQLGTLARRPFDALSGGERQRLFVALALVGRTRLVFLDELTQNLDPVARRHTWDVVRRIREQGTTVVLVTHDVEEAEQLCDRVVILDGGRVVADGTPAQVAAAGDDLTTVAFTDAELDTRPLATLPGVNAVRRHGPQVVVRGRGPLLAHVGAHLVAVGRPALDLRANPPSLQSRFVALTSGDAPTTTNAEEARP
jgi:ABC-2 type transport system ATP-binding protein